MELTSITAAGLLRHLTRPQQIARMLTGQRLDRDFGGVPNIAGGPTGSNQVAAVWSCAQSSRRLGFRRYLLAASHSACAVYTFAVFTRKQNTVANRESGNTVGTRDKQENYSSVLNERTISVTIQVTTPQKISRTTKKPTLSTVIAA
jgi:hypothetical protein